MKNNQAALVEIAVMLKTTHSPNLLHTKHVGFDCINVPPTTIHVGMELCDSDLRSILPISHEYTKKIGKIIVGAAKAMEQVHKLDIIHRDVKPENFMIKDNSVKLGDFGLAEMSPRGYGRIGTPGYMAPEVILSEKKKQYYDSKSDIWGLGATLCELLTGDYLVKNAKNESECLCPHPQWYKVDQKFQGAAEVCKMLLISDPKKRISASDFLQKIREVIPK